MTNNKMLIQDAFINILAKESFYNITVKNIIEVAGVSRSTFYNYYQDKILLLKDITSTFLEGMVAKVQQIAEKGVQIFLEAAESKYYFFLEEFFIYMRQHHRYLKVLLRENNGTNFRSNFLVTMNKTIIKVLTQWDLYELFQSNPFSEYILQIITASCIVTFTKWLRSDMKISEKEMTAFFSQFLSGQFSDTMLEHAKQQLGLESNH